MIPIVSYFYFVRSISTWSDAKLCEAFFSGSQDLASVDTEITKRLKMRFDSTSNNIDYYTIISKPACEPEIFESNINGKHFVARTKQSVEDMLKHRFIQESINGSVFYHYERINGNLSKKYVNGFQAEKYGTDVWIKYGNDTISKNKDFEMYIHFLKEVEKYEFYVLEGTNYVKYPLSEANFDNEKVKKYSFKVTQEGKQLFTFRMKLLINGVWETKDDFFFYVVPPLAQGTVITSK